RAVNYADKHAERALTPAAVMSSEGFRLALSPQQMVSSLRQLKETGDYIWSGRDEDNPAKRAATVRAAMEALLSFGLPSVPAGGLDPFLDFVAEKIVADSSAAQAASATSAGPDRPGP